MIPLKLFSPVSLLIALISNGCLNDQSFDIPKNHEELGYYYSRDKEFIYYRGKRIDSTIPHDIDFLRKHLDRNLTIPTDVDSVSFMPLSDQYSRDKNKVYYKWIRGGKQFWVVEIDGADSESFEVLGFSLAKDKNHVWQRDSKVKEADPLTTEVFTSRVWKDAKNVWFSGRIIKAADPETFEPIGDGYHYRDSNKVYWIFNIVKVVENADPKKFTPPQRK